MIAIDAGLLAYAVNRHAPEHPRALAALESLAGGATPWALPWPAAHAFLRFVTHPHAVARPLTPGDAWAFIESLLASPSLRALAPTERHAAVVAELIAAQPGTDPSALELAAVLREHGVRELLSGDRAMRRFAFLTVRDPLHGEPWSAGAPPLKRYRRLTPRPPARRG